jgi:polysaccharide biosynthesis protein PslG
VASPGACSTLFHVCRWTLACWLLAAAPAAAADADSPYGVNAHQAADEALQLVADAGIGWVRFDMNWFQFEPAKGQYDWTIADRFVGTADDLGLGVFVTIAYTPAWAVGHACDDGAEDDADHCLNAVPANPQDWTDFVAAAVARYGDRVNHWGMWNEPNLDHFFRGTRDQYVNEILIPGSETVHALCPGCQVLGPELANLREVHWDAEEGDCYEIGCSFNGWNHSLMRILQDAGDHIDIVTHHKYADPADLWWSEMLNGEWILIQIMWGAKEITDEHAPGKPVWITEFGWHSQPWGEHSDPYAAEQLTRVYDGMCQVSAGTLESPYIEPVNQPWPELRRLFWYDLNEDPSGHSWGLLTWDLQPKDPYWAYVDTILANGNCLGDPAVGDDDDDDGDDDSAADEDADSTPGDGGGGGCGCRQPRSSTGPPVTLALLTLLAGWRARQRRGDAAAAFVHHRGTLGVEA